MKLEIAHTTHYSFETPPVYGLQKLRLTPKSNVGQTVLDWSIDIEGGTIQAEYEDEFKNKVHLIKLTENAKDVSIVSEGRLEMTDQNGVIGQHGGFAPLWIFKRVTPFTKAGPKIKALAKDFPIGTQDVSAFHDLSRTIARAVKYQSGITDSATTAEQAVSFGQGVCQDHAHIFLSIARASGYASRYVSGYLMMNDRIIQDATHAWAEVYLEGLGWTGFDVSNQISPDARYVRLATGLDYNQAAPISGLTLGGLGETINVSVQVQQHSQSQS